MIWYKEQDKKLVNEYMKKISKVCKDKIAYVDETGIDKYFYREYAYAPKGQAVHSKISGRKFGRTNIVAAQIGKEIVAPMQYKGTTDSTLFEYWFEHCLLPCLKKDTVIVMDNASFHRKNRLFQIADKFKFQLIFLPPYSPELNPIEKFWSRLKRSISSNLHLFTSLNLPISHAFLPS